MIKPDDWAVHPVSVPDISALASLAHSGQLADAFEIRLPGGTTANPEQLARFVFAQQAPWVRTLMSLRDRIVRVAGLKTARELRRSGPGGPPRIGIFRIYAMRPDEILIGEDDRHLDFRVSLLHQVRQNANPLTAYLTLSTVVSCHNLLGRAYLFVIAPFHRLVVRSALRGAARRGWPAATSG